MWRRRQKGEGTDNNRTPMQEKSGGGKPSGGYKGISCWRLLRSAAKGGGKLENNRGHIS